MSRCFLLLDLTARRSGSGGKHETKTLRVCQHQRARDWRGREIWGQSRDSCKCSHGFYLHAEKTGSKRRSRVFSGTCEQLVTATHAHTHTRGDTPLYICQLHHLCSKRARSCNFCPGPTCRCLQLPDETEPECAFHRRAEHLQPEQHLHQPLSDPSAGGAGRRKEESTHRLHVVAVHERAGA